MIFIYHKNAKTVAVESEKGQSIEFDSKLTVAETLYVLAQRFASEKLIWCHVDLKKQLNIEGIEPLFHHKKILVSYNPSTDLFLDTAIGYVDETPFIKLNKSVTFPTWQMSSAVGGIFAEILFKLIDSIPLDKNFDYFLCSLAKLSMSKGLLCYSEPRLLKQKIETAPLEKTSRYILFRFVKQHYRTRWVFLLLINFFLYERKLPFLPVFFSLFYKNRAKNRMSSDNALENIEVQSLKRVINKATIDIIIPTIGRKKYLYNVLKDFSKQTILPNNIVIVEQNPQEDSISELDYLKSENWPFEIQHIFTHQAGACNARNLALSQTHSEWVFLADDDNRFEPTLLSDVFDKIKQFGALVVTTSYPQKNEIKKRSKVIQWPTFGAGNSFVRRDVLDKVRFNMSLEFGYGEDGDFGMQLRNQGYDILYLPEPEILHLKAPIGGFRTKPVLKWQNDSIQPKPSPTVMLYQISHNTKEQILGYKTILFFKYYKHQKIKNPIKYYFNFQKQWERSVFWANELKRQNEV
ncbi:glycosyltransferase family 2 protein [Flavobacterium aquicola]|uniref:GT2 family glycosyltransferase n=1 Tax=Flavobacterium aquicola TaxID=1682742 RepID=A0A3E0EMB9_9FLAO|nr:glycosyltransferase family A protein [Flavobacterium aquicola]REG98286.1 GT2 family glycosyltransferase [Flavobacterium aquicola]